MTTYVCGHRNPDTDSIVAAISYAALYNMLGENDYVPVRLGHLNDESQFLLNRFGFEPPAMISNVRTQIRDVEFDKPPRLAAGVPVSYAWNLLMEHPNLSVLPITNEDETLYGLITEKTPELLNVGCESCHGPGERHIAVELDSDEAAQDRIRNLMRLGSDVKKVCYACHDGDNSPEFEFDVYYPLVAHEEDADEDIKEDE